MSNAKYPSRLTNQIAIHGYRPIELDKYSFYFQIVIAQSAFWGITDAAPGMVFGSKKGKDCCKKG
jgi:hypothetical protein